MPEGYYRFEGYPRPLRNGPWKVKSKETKTKRKIKKESKRKNRSK